MKLGPVLDIPSTVTGPEGNALADDAMWEVDVGLTVAGPADDLAALIAAAFLALYANLS